MASKIFKGISCTDMDWKTVSYRRGGRNKSGEHRTKKQHLSAGVASNRSYSEVAQTNKIRSEISDETFKSYSTDEKILSLVSCKMCR